MKKLRKLCAATVLLFVLSLSALAGTIHTNAVPEPTPTPPAATASEPDETSTGGDESALEFESLFTEITVSLLQLLSVF